jgi:hypothetical protein
MKRTMSALFLFAVVGAACGSEPAAAPTERPKSSPTPAATWSGPGQHGEDGSNEVDGFNAYVSDARAGWVQSPIRMALEFLALGDPSDPDGGAFITTAEQRASPEGGTEATVTVTLQGLLDDSVQAVRYSLVFEKKGDTWKLVTATWGQRCAEGRGHQDFSVELCV